MWGIGVGTYLVRGSDLGGERDNGRERERESLLLSIQDTRVKVEKGGNSKVPT
jgi:hypothetical protein